MFILLLGNGPHQQCMHSKKLLLDLTPVRTPFLAALCARDDVFLIDTRRHVPHKVGWRGHNKLQTSHASQLQLRSRCC